MQVINGSVYYFIYGEAFATHGHGNAPTAPLSINFNLVAWIDVVPEWDPPLTRVCDL